MKTIVFINPLKPGKIQEYQAFIAENTGPRKKEYTDLFHRYGLRNVKIYHHKLEDKEFIVVIHDVEEDAVERLSHFFSSTNSYDRWFVKKLEDLHDLDTDPYAKFIGEFETQGQSQLFSERQNLIRNFYQELEKENYDLVSQFFDPHGKVHSPIYGILEAKAFYKKLAKDTKAIKFTIKNIFTDEHNPHQMAVYATSSWGLNTGKSGHLEVVNIFEFIPDSTHIQSLKIIYDTHSIRPEFAFQENKK